MPNTCQIPIRPESIYLYNPHWVLHTDGSLEVIIKLGENTWYVTFSDICSKCITAF